MTKLPKNLIRYDHENETIYVSRAIYKNSLVYQSSEFNLVKRAHEAFPNYKVLPRERIKSSNAERFAGLNYDRMRMYLLRWHPDREKAFDEQLLLSKGHSRRMPVIRKWFFENCPEFLEYGKTELANEMKKVKSEKENMKEGENNERELA